MYTSLQNKITSLVLFILLLTGLHINAANEIILNPGGSNSINVLENTFYRLQVSNTISSFNTLWLNTEKGEFVELLTQSYSKSNTTGAPQLPVLSKLIEVPAGAVPAVTVISYDVREYKLADFGITQKLFPAQAPQAKSSTKIQAFAFNRELYETNSFYGETLARVEVAGYLRSMQLANLVISPVEYNPVTNTIRVYNNLIVEVRFNGADKAKSRTVEPEGSVLNSPWGVKTEISSRKKYPFTSSRKERASASGLMIISLIRSSQLSSLLFMCSDSLYFQWAA